MADDMIEMKKSEVEQFQRAYKILNGMINHKDKSMEAKKLAKEIDPSLNFPELSAAETASKAVDEKSAKLEAEIKEMKEWRAQQEEEKKTVREKNEESGLKKTLDQVRKEFGFTDEGMDKVIKRMKEKNNPDVESAAAYVASKEPKPALMKDSPSYLPSNMDLYGSHKKDEAWKDLHNDPMSFFDKEVVNVLNNPENYKEFGGDL